jgi:hypothetical protein
VRRNRSPCVSVFVSACCPKHCPCVSVLVRGRPWPVFQTVVRVCPCSSVARNLLRANAAMRRRQTHHRRGAAAEPPCTLERHHVGRIGYDFGAAQRRQHLVLARVPHAGADAQRRDGRQLHRFKRRGCRQQMPIDFDQAPLIDKRRLHERSRSHCSTRSAGARAPARASATSSNSDHNCDAGSPSASAS